jgi:hypothetical protein
LVAAIEPEDVASPGEYETNTGTRVPSAKSGTVLWPKKPKTQKTNAVVRENLSRSFDSFTGLSPLLDRIPAIRLRRIALPKVRDCADLLRGLKQEFVSGETEDKGHVAQQ